MTQANKEDDVVLKRVLCIDYLIQFKENKMRALINLSSEVNAMTLRYSSKLGLKIYFTNVRAQKIYDSTLEMFRVVLPSLQVENKLSRAQFFQKTNLLANINLELVLGMFFFTLSNGNI